MDNSFFVNEVPDSWILNILGNDISRELSLLGYKCRKGGRNDYDGEDIAIHMWWRNALPFKSAKKNVVFVTHTDDAGKESSLMQMKDDFDAYICMSKEDAQFLKELGFDENKVFGIELPVRNNYIKPLSLAIFSNCYADGRKNERWLLEYCETHPDAKLVNFVFLGGGWYRVGEKLSALGCSFTWHCIGRKLPHEYFYQQLSLSEADYYLYMGFDGGAMGTYDAYAMGLNLCIADDGYHKAIPDIDYKFNNQTDFNHCLDEIIARQRRKIDFFDSHSVRNYVNELAYVSINGKYPYEDNSEFDYSVKQKRRDNYFKMTIKRYKELVLTDISKLIIRKKYNA